MFTRNNETRETGHDLAAEHEAHVESIRERAARRQAAVHARLAALEDEMNVLVDLNDRI